MYDSLKFNFLNEYKDNQNLFFTLNTDEQFRGYHIAKGEDTSVEEYENFNTIDKFSSNNTILLDTNIIDQKTFFKSNLLLQFIGYYIAHSKADSLEIVKTTQFKLNLTSDENISDRFSSVISEATEIVEDILVTYSTSELENQSKLIKITEYPRTDDILGSAYPYRTPREIEINTEYTLPNNMICYLNVDGDDTSYDLLTVTLVHELLHMLGIGIHDSWNSNLFISNNNMNNLFYIGDKGLEKYLDLLSVNNLSTGGIIGIPIENNFGYGSVDVHFEEGLNDNFDNENRYHNDILHPSIPGEIMTPYVNVSVRQYSKNYITILTLGILEDMDYTVNYESKYVTKSEDVEILYGE